MTAAGPYYTDDQVTLWHGDALQVLRAMTDGAVDCVVTSPPYYGLRDYGEPGQYGLEPSPAEYVDTIGMPWRVAFALQDDGWILRNAVVWDKPNAMPESVTDRLATTYELVFMFTRSPRYWFDLDAVREPLTGGADPTVERKASRAGRFARAGDGVNAPHSGFLTNGHERGRNPGDVWSIPTQPFPAAHFAVMAPELARRCIIAGCRPGGTVLDPFCGSGTTGMVALKHGRRFVCIDLSATYLDLALRTRLNQSALVDDVTILRS